MGQIDKMKQAVGGAGSQVKR